MTVLTTAAAPAPAPLMTIPAGACWLSSALSCGLPFCQSVAPPAPAAATSLPFAPFFSMLPSAVLAS